MAAKGSFGSYSSVPTTTGMGQGSAQVFTPQAIQLDTTAIQRGAQAIGQGISDAAAEKKATEAKAAKAKAEEKKERAKLAAEAAALANGEFPVYQQALKRKSDTSIDKILSGDLNEEEAQLELATLKTDLLNIKAQEKRDADMMKVAAGDPNKKIYDENQGKWISAFEYNAQRLNQDLNSDLASSVDEGIFGQLMGEDYIDANEMMVQYEPDFNLDREVVDQFSKWAGSSKETQLYLTQVKDGVDLQTVASQMSDDQQQAFRDHMKRQTDLQAKWAGKSMVDQNLPAYITKDPQFGQELKDQYVDYIDGMILPSTRQTTLSTRNQPSEANAAKIALENIANSPVITSIKTENGEEKTVMGTTYNLDEVMPIDFRDKETGKMVKGQGKVTRTFQDKDGQMYMEFIPFVDKESGGIDLTGIPEKYHPSYVFAAAMMGKGAADSKYVLDPKQKRTIPISDKDINYDAFVGAVAKSAKSSKEDAAMRIKSFGEKRLIEEEGVTNIFGEPIKGGKSYRIADSNDNKTTVELYGGKSEKKYIASNGYAYTKQQLIDADYTEEYIKSLKTQ
jgi:hypothetical protein